AGVSFDSAYYALTRPPRILTLFPYTSLFRSASLTYTVTVTAPAVGTLLNVARADAATTDPDSTNNNGSAAASRVTTTVGAVADRSVSNTAPPHVRRHGVIRHPIVNTNNGPSV